MKSVDPNDIIARNEQVQQRRVVAERIWYGLLAVIAALVLGAAVVSSAAARPETCTTCHRVEAKALQADAHRGVTCDDCHAGLSPWELYNDRLEAVDMVVRQIVPGRSNTAAQVDNGRCLVCHTAEQMAKTITVNGIKMNHRAPIEKKVPCVSCHPTVGHGKRPDRRQGYSMDSCMTCHTASAKNIDTCTSCHTDASGRVKEASNKVTPWRVTHGPQWRSNHGMGNLATCSGCHQENFCLKCHNVPVPHDETFLQEHGKQVLAIGPAAAKGCTDCHKASSCQNCHGVEMPHPSGFLKGHPALVKKSGKTVCSRCHSKKSCDDCHARHIHPGLDSNYLKQLKARPVRLP